MARDGEDLRRLPLFMRGTNLARLLARRPDGIFVAPFEQRQQTDADLFRRIASSGLKRRDRPYQRGRSKHWMKVNNRNHPAMGRVMEAFADK
jgi:ATP-dependent DNA ligase